MSDIRAIKITHDGAVSRVTLHQDGDSSTLQAMYEQIECHTVDCIGLDQDMDMWIDDEGKFVEPPQVNKLATVLFRAVFKDTMDWIAGNVLITGGADDEGGTVGIGEAQATEIERFLGMVKEAMAK